MRSAQATSFQHYERSLSRTVPIKSLGPTEESHDSQLRELNTKLIGESAVMQTLKKAIRTVARSTETVLITGESGTGKVLIARAIHDLSSRRSQPFLAINCGALTESLLESELFGHVKGAFTGATSNKKGFFEAAGDGTIFLDEFAEMSPATQAKLLRVLEERKVRPVGLTEAREIALHARIVVATNHDLRDDVLAGKFRHDLYYRVNVLQIHAPALRDRRDDILSLSEHFIHKYNERNRCHISDHISSEVLGHLTTHSWPGNVRELENIINRLAIKVGDEGVLSGPDLVDDSELIQENPKSSHALQSTLPNQPSRLSQTDSLPSRVLSLRKCQCRSRKELDEYIRIVNESNGNISQAARQLNIPRTTLQSRLMILRDKCGLTEV